MAMKANGAFRIYHLWWSQSPSEELLRRAKYLFQHPRHQLYYHHLACLLRPTLLHRAPATPTTLPFSIWVCTCSSRGWLPFLILHVSAWSALLGVTLSRLVSAVPVWQQLDYRLRTRTDAHTSTWWSYGLLSRSPWFIPRGGRGSRTAVGMSRHVEETWVVVLWCSGPLAYGSLIS